jgi:dienelactone hydrolase
MRALVLLLLLVAAPAWAETVTIPGPEGVELRARLLLPEGAPVAPAIVALHGCGGPYPQRDAQWGEVLRRHGHIVLFPDSFGSRGLGSQCREQRRTVTAAGLRRRDALAAAQWLHDRPRTPPGGVVLMGWSDGGSTVLAAGRDHPTRRGLIRGLVAFYPGCGAAARLGGWQPAAPMLLLHGEADDWTPIWPCRALAEEAGPVVTLVAYPGAWHNFDVDIPVRQMRDIPSSRRGDGIVHVGGDMAARADAMARIPAFLAALPVR